MPSCVQTMCSDSTVTKKCIVYLGLLLFLLFCCIFCYTLWVKKQDTKLLPMTSNINRLSNFFTDGLGGKFAINLYLNVPLCLKDVATLPCEIWMSEKWHQCEICIVINEKSQGSITKHLRNDDLFCYTFITQSAGGRIFKIGEVTGKRQSFHAPHSHCTFVLKDADLTR